MSSINTIYHTTLSTYFQTKPLYLDEPTQKKPNTRKLVEQPWQQRSVRIWDAVFKLFFNLFTSKHRRVLQTPLGLKNQNPLVCAAPDGV